MTHINGQVPHPNNKREQVKVFEQEMPAPLQVTSSSMTRLHVSTLINLIVVITIAVAISPSSSLTSCLNPPWSLQLLSVSDSSQLHFKPALKNSIGKFSLIGFDTSLSAPSPLFLRQSHYHEKCHSK